MSGRNQFVVPQFLDVESKIIGFITMRQFLIMLGVLIIEFFIYRLFLNLFVQLVLGIPVLTIGSIFAFFKVNGQPFHFIVLNMVQSFRKPMLRVWDKTLTDADLKLFLNKDEPLSTPPLTIKTPIERGRLAELTLVVNTGGVYNPDE